MHQPRTLDGGLEVHTDALAVAYGAADPPPAVVFRGAMGPRPGDIDHRIRPLQSKSQHLVCV